MRIISELSELLADAALAAGALAGLFLGALLSAALVVMLLPRYGSFVALLMLRG